MLGFIKVWGEQRVGWANFGRQGSSAAMRRFVCAVLVAVSAALLWSAPPAPAAEVVHPTLVRTIATSGFTPPSPDPSGIVYMPGQDRLLISDSEVDETGLYQGFNLFTATRTGSGFGSGTLLPRGNLVATSKEPAGLAFKASDSTLYVSDDDKDRVSVVRPGSDGVHGTADDIVSRFSTSAFGSTDPEDVAYDPATGHLFVCDGASIEMYDVDPVNGTFGDGNDVVTHFDLARYGLRDCEGLGLDASRNALLPVDWRTDAIYELSKDGDLLRTLSLSAIPTSNSVVADVTIAPTSDPNDDPSAMNYWIVDRHVDNNARTPPPNDGLLYEMSLGAPPPPPPPPRTLTVQTQGDGTGTVTGPGISCPGDCTETYADGQQVILTATPTGGSSFGGWSGACSGSGPCQLTMDADKQTTATFNASPDPLPQFSLPIRAGLDDADENQSGTVRRTNGDINLGSGSGGSPTTAALRFTGVQIPNGAVIADAEVQFTADETGNAATNLVVRAERADNSAPIGSTAFNISSRPVTAASVPWSVPAWQTLEAAGPDQLTPNLAAVIQEVVDRPGWAPGNALTVIVTGTGRRAAESFEGGAPAVLQVAFAGL
jgi:hypothetical protein